MFKIGHIVLHSLRPVCGMVYIYKIILTHALSKPLILFYLPINDLMVKIQLQLRVQSERMWHSRQQTWRVIDTTYIKQMSVCVYVEH